MLIKTTAETVLLCQLSHTHAQAHTHTHASHVIPSSAPAHPSVLCLFVQYPVPAAICYPSLLLWLPRRLPPLSGLLFWGRGPSCPNNNRADKYAQVSRFSLNVEQIGVLFHCRSRRGMVRLQPQSIRAAAPQVSSSQRFPQLRKLRRAPVRSVLMRKPAQGRRHPQDQRCSWSCGCLLTDAFSVSRSELLAGRLALARRRKRQPRPVDGVVWLSR